MKEAVFSVFAIMMIAAISISIIGLMAATIQSCKDMGMEKAIYECSLACGSSGQSMLSYSSTEGCKCQNK